MDRSQLHRNMPDSSQLSVLAAIIILAYAMSGFLTIPERDFGIQLPGLFISFQINIQTIIGFLVAGITAAGANWLYRSHPALSSGFVFHHWIVPSLTALVIGILLFQLPYGAAWLLGLFLGGGLLVLVLVAEYIAIDEQDVRHPLAVIGLTSVSYALFLILVVSMRTSGVRLFIVLPAVTVAAWLVSLRVIQLRLYGEWTMIESAIIAIILGQIAASFHYWPFNPISYGLVLLGPAYALNSLMIGLIEGKNYRHAVREPILALLFAWVLAILMG
jgi:Protein of unknown function (DUF5656)